jgi:hypothetical protein
MACAVMTGALPPPIELVAFSDFVDFSNRLSVGKKTARFVVHYGLEH